MEDEGRFSVGFQPLSMGGHQYFIPEYAKHRPAAKVMLHGHWHEPATHELVRAVLRSCPGSMIHAGAFFGDMLPSFSSAASGTVYAFEPVLENYILAKLCVEHNNLDNVVLINAALSVDIGNLRIHSTLKGGRHAGGASHIAEEGRLCPAISIDHLQIADLVLLQLDVEGHEMPALTGARDTIMASRPIIAIEDNGRDCAGFLGDMEYENVGDVPGLAIWAPAEGGRHAEVAADVLGCSRQKVPA